MTTEKTTEKIVTAEDIFTKYILECYTPDDFRNMSVDLWGEILPEIEEFFEDEGQVFNFTDEDIPMLKTVIDNMFDAEFGKEIE